MRPTPKKTIWLLAPIVFGAPAIAGEMPPSAEVVLLQKCSIEYERATSIGTRQSLNVGSIQECLVRAGDRVKAGQVLGRLYNEDVLAELEARVVSRENSEIAIHQREAALQVEKAKLWRDEVLRNKAALSVQDLQIQQLAVKNAELELQAAVQNRRMAEVQVQQVRTQLAAREIISPHDGLVVEVYKKVGEPLMAGVPIFRVVDINRLRVVGYLNATDAWRVRQGQAVQVVPELDGVELAIEHETFVGKITFVDSEIDPKTRTCRVFAEVENCGGLLRSGLDCRMEINPRNPPGTRADAAGPVPGRPAGVEVHPRPLPGTSDEGLAREGRRQ